MWLENLNCPYYHELELSQKYGRFYEVTWIFQLLLLSRGKNFSQKLSSFIDVTLKFELPLLSRAAIISKIWQILWSHLNIRTASIITR